MQPRNRTFVRLLDAAQHRFRRARPGSVLIMVVSLLVLLALIGTAAMSTSRLDRSSSQQNVKNVQVDILAEGVKRMVLGILSKDASAANFLYTCAWHNDGPLLIRITMKVDDPTGKLKDGQWYQYILSR